MTMGGGLIALEQLKHAGQLCGLLKHLGVVQDCPAQDLPEGVQRALDKKIMCEIYHCCKDPKKNPRPNNEHYSQCVQDVVDRVDRHFGRKGHFKSEVSFKKDGSPWMYGNSTTPRRPTGAVPRYPAGSSRPDVVVVKDPTKPPISEKIIAVKNPNAPMGSGNIDQIYEFKFPGDKWGSDQRERYESLGGPGSVTEISDDTCSDEDGEKQGVLATASAFQLSKDNAWFAATNKATAAIAGGAVTGPAGRAAGAAKSYLDEALSAFGRVLGVAK